MPRISSHLGQIAAEVKAFVADHAAPSQLRATAGRLLDGLFPPHGFDDHDGARQGVGLHANSWSGIRFLDREGCDMCARPFGHGLHFGPGALCDACTDKPFPFRRARAACLYNDASRDIILRFKHGDRLDLTPMLVRWLERSAGDLIDDADVLVPVPLHPFRLLSRRYNQAAELARPLASLRGKAFLPDALQRIRRTPRQAKSAAERRANLRNAFAVTASGRKRIDGRRVVLIDDVLTSGATASACAQVLLDAGALSVDIAVLARAAHTNL